MFDGTTIYLTKKLSLDNLCFPIKIIDSKEDFKITLKFEKEIDMLDSNSVNILNLILRRTLEGLKMQRIGKNLYDASAMVR